jgi:hypothetical protein
MVGMSDNGDGVVYIIETTMPIGGWQGMRTWRLTGEVRYWLPAESHPDMKLLQQASVCVETGERRWDDVPLKVGGDRTAD